MSKKPDILKGIDLPTDEEIHEETKKVRLSEAAKLRMQNPTTREKLRQANLGKVNGPLTDETKKKIAESVKGHNRPHTKETKSKMSKARMGHDTSAETRKKIGEKSKGRIHSEESRQKNREAHLGKKQTAEHIAKVSAALKGKKRGPISEEHRRKLREAASSRRSKPSPHKTPYGVYETANEAVKGFQLENSDIIMNKSKMRRWVLDPNNLEYYKITIEEYREAIINKLKDASDEHPEIQKFLLKYENKQPNERDYGKMRKFNRELENQKK